MDKHQKDSPGDCQTAVADSTTAKPTAAAVAATTTTVESTPAAHNRHLNEATVVNSSSSSGGGRSTSHDDVQVSSTTINLNEATAAAAESTAKPNASPPTGNKIKSQQQQQPQQHHQFRAPQQFVKHKKSTSALQKKNKTWNKRQNKFGKPTNSANIAAGLTTIGGAGGSGGVGIGIGIGVATGSNTLLSTTKADLENIQNLRNQPGGYHFYHRGGSSGGASGGGIVNVVEGRNANANNNNGQPPALVIDMDKIGYGHGHLKQQFYKKMLTHRGGQHHHHQHVLCAGAAHNSLGGGGGGVGVGVGVGVGIGVGNANLNCCHINGCSNHNGKDAASLNGGAVGGGGNVVGVGVGNANANSVGIVPYYCCIRSKFFLPDKRPRKEIIIPPTKFLLGGNISDPLNLNSLQNETSNTSANTTPATTPRQSPITTPPKVEVIIPPNIHDPLHLLDPVDSMEYEKQLTSPMKRVGCIGGKIALGLRSLTKSHHKHRHRKNRKPKRRRHDSYNSNATTSNVSNADLEDTSSLGNSIVSTGDTSTSTLSLSNIENSNSSFNALLATATATTTNSLVAESDEHLSKIVGSPNQMEQAERNTLLIDSPTHSHTQTPAAAAAAAVQSNISTQQLAMDTTEVGQQAADGNGNVVVVAATNAVVDTSSSTAGAAAATIAASAVVVDKAVVVANVAGDLLSRERPNRDLRLELNSTTATAAAAATTPNSTCGNSIVVVGNNVALPGNGGACGGIGGGRKRKTSESNNSQKSKKFPRYDVMDKIVSPVVPQPGAWKRPPRLVASGARKSATRRSRSVSECEALSPVDESVKSISFNEETLRDDIPDLMKFDSISDSAMGSPLSTISAATSVATGEQESIADTSLASTADQMAPPTAGTELLQLDATATVVEANVIKPKANQTLARLTKTPKFTPAGAKYRYGNYDRYTSSTLLNEFMDVRLQVFQRHLELFQNKDILDIGCNSGHMTITMARHFAPKSILGIDIDKDLIARARRNLTLYVRIPLETKPLKKCVGEASSSEPLVKAEEMGTMEKPNKRQRKRFKRKQANLQQHQQHHHHHQQHQHQHHHHHHHQHLQQQQHQHQLHQQLFLHHHHSHHHHYHHFYHQLQKQQQLKALHVGASELFPVSFPLTYGGIPTIQAAATGTTITTPAPAATTSSSANNDSCPAATVQTSAGAAVATNATPTSSANTVIASPTKQKNDFPRNVFFRHTNYVLKDEAMLANDTQQYDVIMCLSVTKWIQLNFGDAGLKLAFKRMFNQLRPGGKLILEAQNWASYKKKKNLTEDIYNNYRQIELFPNKFHEYLLSSEVGFSHSYTLGVPRHLNKGFSRPIQLYAKGDYTPNHVRWSDAYYPQTPYEAYRGIYATMPPRPPGLIYPMSSTRSQNYDTPHYTGSASGSYSCRQTPMHQPTSQYYNPLETDSYQPSYDMEYLNHMYVFASPLYQTVWSPPASMRRNSSTHTPIFGSVRDAEYDGDGSAGGSGGGGGSYHRHVYPPNDDTMSPNANAGNAFNSIRDPDTDDSNQLPGGSKKHVYATNCGESSSSPQVNHHDVETIEGLMLDDEQVVVAGGGGSGGGGVAAATAAATSAAADLQDA